MTSYFGAFVIFVFFLISFRVLDKQWLPPACIFVFGFVSATFLYSISITALEVDSPSFAYENFELATQYSTACFLFLLLGYLVHGVAFRTRRKSSVLPIEPYDTGSIGSILLVSIFIACLAITLINHPFLSSADYVRGADSYPEEGNVGVFYRLSFVASQIFGPLVLSLCVISVSRRSKSETIRWLAVFGVVVIVALTLLAFDRHQAVSIILMVAVLYHFRVKAFRLKQVAACFVPVLVLQATRTLRSESVSVNDFDFDVVLHAIGEIDVVALLVGPFTAIGGWDVLTNVFNLVPSVDDFKYGATYLDSLFGIFMPRALGLGSYGAETPSVWYVNLYAPGTTGHGYDFSMVAESYINFGLYGCAVFFAFGFMVRWISIVIARSSSPYAVTFAIIALEVFTFGLRMDSNATIKGIVYKAASMALLLLFINRLQASKNPMKSP